MLSNQSDAIESVIYNPDLLNIILKMLDIPDINRAARVCRFWNEASDYYLNKKYRRIDEFLRRLYPVDNTQRYGCEQRYMFVRKFQQMVNAENPRMPNYRKYKLLAGMLQMKMAIVELDLLKSICKGSFFAFSSRSRIHNYLKSEGFVPLSKMGKHAIKVFKAFLDRKSKDDEVLREFQDILCLASIPEEQYEETNQYIHLNIFKTNY